jgi:hypothetical protein
MVVATRSCAVVGRIACAVFSRNELHALACDATALITATIWAYRPPAFCAIRGGPTAQVTHDHNADFLVLVAGERNPRFACSAWREWPKINGHAQQDQSGAVAAAVARLPRHGPFIARDSRRRTLAVILSDAVAVERNRRPRASTCGKNLKRLVESASAT